MPRSPIDLNDIPTSQFRRLAEIELIGLVVHGRVSDNGADIERGRSAWEELVLREYDRVNQLVKAFRFPDQPAVRVQPDDVDDVVQAAFMRLLGMFENFRGSSVGEFRAALATCVRFACMDFCRAQMNVEKGIAGSIDERIDSGDGAAYGRFDGELGRLEQQHAAAREAAQHQVRRIGDALDGLDNEQMQAVLRMSWENRSVEDIAEELGLTPDNVYQLRSRGQRKLLADLHNDGHGKDSKGDAR